MGPAQRAHALPRPLTQDSVFSAPTARGKEMRQRALHTTTGAHYANRPPAAYFSCRNVCKLGKLTSFPMMYFKDTEL